MNTKFSTTDNFNKFKDQLREALNNHTLRRIKIQNHRDAAVLVLLVDIDSVPHVVLTQRSETVSTHKGQISFPGGGYEKGDISFAHTALRETCEEIGISPDKIEILGEFDEFFSVSRYHVRVFVGAADYPLAYKMQSCEIDRILEVPLAVFTGLDYSKKERHSHLGLDFNIYFYDYRGSTIWGMTARILTDLSRKILNRL